MKRYHLILILLFAAVCSFLLWQGHALQEKETELRKVASQAATPPSSPISEHPSPSATRSQLRKPSDFDPSQYLAKIRSLSANYDPNDRRADRPIRMFLFQSKSQLAGLPVDELKQICAELEKDGLDDVEELFWGSVVEAAAHSAPAWAIDKIAEFTPTQVTEEPQKTILSVIGKESPLLGQFGEYWSPAYAAALDQWLDNAEAEGRLKGLEPQVAPLRFDTALATGDLSGAIGFLHQLTPEEQNRRAADLATAAHESGQGRRMIEAIATTARPTAFEVFAREFSRHSGFENASATLVAAKLTPEHHDLAAAGIAAANIGSDTPARAQWFLENLKAETPTAVTLFSQNWTQADHKSAGQWLASLPQGTARDAAIAGFAPQAAHLDGATAVDWALGISDPATRGSTLRSVVQTWTQKEPQAAAYLQQKGIDTE